MVKLSDSFRQMRVESDPNENEEPAAYSKKTIVLEGRDCHALNSY